MRILGFIIVFHSPQPSTPLLPASGADCFPRQTTPPPTLWFTTRPGHFLPFPLLEDGRAAVSHVWSDWHWNAWWPVEGQPRRNHIMQAHSASAQAPLLGSLGPHAVGPFLTGEPFWTVSSGKGSLGPERRDACDRRRSAGIVQAAAAGVASGWHTCVTVLSFTSLFWVPVLVRYSCFQELCQLVRSLIYCTLNLLCKVSPPKVIIVTLNRNEFLFKIKTLSLHKRDRHLRLWLVSSKLLKNKSWFTWYRKERTGRILKPMLLAPGQTWERAGLAWGGGQGFWDRCFLYPIMGKASHPMEDKSVLLSVAGRGLEPASLFHSIFLRLPLCVSGLCAPSTTKKPVPECDSLFLPLCLCTNRFHSLGSLVFFFFRLPILIFNNWQNILSPMDVSPIPFLVAS